VIHTTNVYKTEFSAFYEVGDETQLVLDVTVVGSIQSYAYKQFILPIADAETMPVVDMTLSSDCYECKDG